MAAAVIANPAPLGLVAFGLTTLLLSFINAGVIPGTSVPVVLATAIPFGGLCQLLAGMWEFRTGNTFGATAFTSYGAFWISFVLINTTFGAELPKDPTPILGLYALAWGIFTLYMFAASLGGASRAVSLVFLLLALTFFALAIGFWGHDAGGTGWTQIGGILGILTAVAAMYTSFAGVLNANFKRTVLPI
ncbi:MAG: acetate uptake transporter [Candidatus Dormibacteria bacterium]